MAYTINKTNGQILAIVEDGTINTDTSMTIIGRRTAGYGEFFGENFVKLLESGANSAPPFNPLVGQLWFDTNQNVLKVFNGSSFQNLKIAVPNDSNTTSSVTAPTGPESGDLWFDESVNILKVYNGTNFEDIVTGAGVPPTSFSSIELNEDGTGNRISYIDFHSADLPADYSARVVRNAGANGTFEIINTGTGNFVIAPGGLLQVQGNIQATGNISGVDLIASGNISGVDITASGTITASNLNITGSLTSATSIVENWSVVTSSQTISTLAPMFVDTSTGPVTLTLPATPDINDKVSFHDVASNFNVNSLTIARNGNLIMGLAEDLIVDTQHTTVTLIYAGPTYGWRII